MNIPDGNDTSQGAIVNGERVTLEALLAEVNALSVPTVNPATAGIAQTFDPSLTDEQLAGMGCSPEDIRLLREG